jgi:hypothetical protein
MTRSNTVAVVAAPFQVASARTRSLAPLRDLDIAPENLRFAEPPDDDIPLLAETLFAAGQLQPLTVRPGRKKEAAHMALDGRRADRARARGLPDPGPFGGSDAGGAAAVRAGAQSRTEGDGKRNTVRADQGASCLNDRPGSTTRSAVAGRVFSCHLVSRPFLARSRRRRCARLAED